MCTSGPTQGRWRRPFTGCPPKFSPILTAPSALAVTSSPSPMAWRITALPLFVFHRWSAKTRSSGGKSLRSLLLLKALMLIRLTMYSLLLGNAESRFYVRGKHSGTNQRSSIEIHILNLSDGTPYCAPPSNVIHWATSPGPLTQSVSALIITSSRLMLHACGTGDYNTSGPPWWISVWDWKTGNPVIVP